MRGNLCQIGIIRGDRISSNIVMRISYNPKAAREVERPKSDPTHDRRKSA
jgi:hypothetical protein